MTAKIKRIKVDKDVYAVQVHIAYQSFTVSGFWNKEESKFMKRQLKIAFNKLK